MKTIKEFLMYGIDKIQNRGANIFKVKDGEMCVCGTGVNVLLRALKVYNQYTMLLIIKAEKSLHICYLLFIAVRI